MPLLRWNKGKLFSEVNTYRISVLVLSRPVFELIENGMLMAGLLPSL